MLKEHSEYNRSGSSDNGRSLARIGTQKVRTKFQLVHQEKSQNWSNELDEGHYTNRSSQLAFHKQQSNQRIEAW